MESLKDNKKRKQRNPEGDIEEHTNENNDDTAMQDVVPVEQEQRKIIKVKKRVVTVEDKLYDENGQEIEFEGEVEEQDIEDEEEVIQRDEDGNDDEWEDEDDEDDDDNNHGKKKEVWDESKAPLQEGEELVFDNSAYQMLHRAKVEWPCLSMDVLLRDRIGQGAS